MRSSEPRTDDLGRFGLSNTPDTRKLLLEMSQQAHAPEDIRRLCKQYADADAVPWKLMQYVCLSARRGDDQAAALDSSASILKGSQLIFNSPPVRQRSKQLEQRLATLQHKIDQQEYAAMVADVTAQEQQAAAAAADPLFPNTKLQLSFGLHVIVTMGTFFALGFYAGRFLFKDQAWAAIMGAGGLAAGLLLETTLLILRTNMPAPLDDKYAHLLGKNWDQQQKQAVHEDASNKQQVSGMKPRQTKQRDGQPMSIKQRSQIDTNRGTFSNAHIKAE